jgi:hypothetical protein
MTALIKANRAANSNDLACTNVFFSRTVSMTIKNTAVMVRKNHVIAKFLAH